MPSWRGEPAKSNRGRGARGNRGSFGHSAPRGSQVHVPSPRQMELIPSVSRSSGLEKDGDTLKDWKVQEDYREFIQHRLNNVLSRRYRRRFTELDSAKRQRVDEQENVLILFRKLREGVSASKRNDEFALEVYETSLYVAVMFESPHQTTSIISHLLPDLYLVSPRPHNNCLVTTLICLVHYLVAAYPSQGLYRQCLAAIPSLMLPGKPEPLTWINSVARSLRSHNFVKFEELTRTTSLSQLLGNAQISLTLDSLSISPRASQSLAREALYTLVNSLRTKSRSTTWDIILHAYRELSCVPPELTSDWLRRSLCLQTVVPDGIDLATEEWLEQQSSQGHVRQKEGVVGKWVICNRKSQDPSTK